MKVRFSCHPAERNGSFLTVTCCIADPLPCGYAECRNAAELAADRPEVAKAAGLGEVDQ